MSPLGVAPAPIQDSEDTEITLGTGKMLALFFVLVILCATFFGMGYSMGRNSGKTIAELLPSPSTSRTNRPLAMSSPMTASQPEAQSNPPAQQTAPDASSAATQSPTSASGSAQQPAAGQPATDATVAPGAGYFVQVAAVSKQEDAQALVESLRGRQYQAFIADQSPDKLFHVQVGPFTDVKEAESMRTRLVNDGYNPILKK